MLNDRVLVRLIAEEPKSWKGIEIVTEGYRQEWDWELAEVLEVAERLSDELKVGDRVIIRAISGGVAGADVSKDLGGEGLVVVTYEEIMAKVEQ